MHVDCDTCAVKGAACSGCVVTVLMGSTPDGIEWDETERAGAGRAGRFRARPAAAAGPVGYPAASRGG